MTKTNYATDSYSNLGGLASVAYGGPDYFREVKNQIHNMSPTRGLDFNMPSSLISGLYGQGDEVKSHISTALNSLNSQPGDFKDWVDVNKSNIGGANWYNALSAKIESELWNNLDSNSEYYKGLESYIEMSLDTPGVSIPPSLYSLVISAISEQLRSNTQVGENIDEMISVVNNNSLTKLDKVPPDTIITLEDSVQLGNDINGVPVSLGYLTPNDYYNNVAYPKMTSDTNNLPTSLNSSAQYGYVGYSPYSLEALFNPAMASSLSDEQGNTINTNLPQALQEISSSAMSMSQQDKNLYNISLLAIDLAGYNSYDPKTMSTGDFLDVASLPKYDETNTDSNKGNLFSSRDKSTTFS